MCSSDLNFRLVDGVQKRKIFTEKILKRNLELASLSHQTHHLPSTVIFYSLPGVVTTLQPAFERAIIPHVRAGDFAAQLDFGFPNLAVLLPLTGERIAQHGVAAALGQLAKDPELSRSVQHRMFTLDQWENGENLWQELIDHAKTTRCSAV